MEENMIQLKGIPASPGIAVGKAFFLDKEEFSIKKHSIDKESVESELLRFDEAVNKSNLELNQVKQKISDSMGTKDARIFEAHLLLLKDPVFVEKIKENVKNNLINIEYAVWQATEDLSAFFRNSEDVVLAERAADIYDVGRRILRNLLGKEREILANLKEEVIVIASDLAPSDTAEMRKEKVIGFVTDMGGRTSHVAIMARSLAIPAIVGLKEVTQRVEPDDLIIVDGIQGIVIINPSEEILEKYRQEKEKITIVENELIKLKDVSAKTIDQREITIFANIEVPEEVETAVKYGAQGIGLYRTEFLFLNRKSLPTEEEQFRAYKHVAQIMSPNPVVIRTLDLGGDKFLSQLNVSSEINPSLGCRGIRLCLQNPEIFKVQLRAILRASVFGKLKIMYPLISGIEELRSANTILKEVKEELLSKGIEINKDIEVGSMIEVPSAAITADIIAKESKFFSIGTNDLIQYSLAIDRVNEKIAYLYEPLHPGILRLIKMIVEAADKAGIKVAMCGEMAGDPFFLPILIGLGLKELSMGPISVPKIKDMVINASYEKSKILTEKIMKLASAKEIEEYLQTQGWKLYI